MLDSLRPPIFVVSLIASGLIVCVETAALLEIVSGNSSSTAAALGVSTPGKAIPALALLDGLLFYVTLMMGIALFVPERIQGRIQGIVTFIISLLVLLACIGAIFMIDLPLLILIMSLLLSPP